MKNNKHCKSESQQQQAQQFNANPIQLILGLCVILGVSAISVRANDNPAQAAARVALEQKMYELDHPQTLPLLAQVTRSEAVVKQQPGKSAANVTAIVSKKAVTPQTALVLSTPVAAPAAVAPAAVAHHKLILMLACFIPSFLVLLVLLQHSRRGNSNQDSISSGDYNSRTNPFTLRLKTGDR